MIDGLTVVIDLAHKPIQLQPRVDETGQVVSFRSERKKIPFGHSYVEARSMGPYLAPGRTAEFVRLHWNPAACHQGHNLFGTRDLQAIAYTINDIVGILGVQPTRPEAMRIASGDFKLLEISLNFPIWFPSDIEGDRWLSCVLNSGSTKSGLRPWAYRSSVYFGSARDKRFKQILLYNKHREMLEARKAYVASALRPEDVGSLLSYAKGMVRFEVTYQTKWLQRRHLSCGRDWFDSRFIEEQLRAEYANLNLPENVPAEVVDELELPSFLRLTYELWKAAGPSKLSIYSASTRARHRRALLVHGVDIQRPPAIGTRLVAPVLDLSGAIPPWAIGTPLYWHPH